MACNHSLIRESPSSTVARQPDSDPIMKELKDYSAEFDPNLKFGDFSKDLILGLTEIYSNLLLIT